MEKPDADTAARYVSRGYLWNAGMFIMSAGVLAAHLARLLPDMHARLETIARAWGTPEFDAVLADNWPHLTKIAIDHAIAEPVAADGGVAVVPADAELGWTDLGDFEALTGIVAQGGNLGEARRIRRRSSLWFPHARRRGTPRRARRRARRGARSDSRRDPRDTTRPRAVGEGRRGPARGPGSLRPALTRRQRAA